jgi:hypothetical protein
VHKNVLDIVAQLDLEEYRLSSDAGIEAAGPTASSCVMNPSHRVTADATDSRKKSV